ncbi:hypothetical protein [Pleurocapsa sp. PCC 7319]|uniref:hypothetical protein n=1 Tax=Pleurocapsa sp. PCC 7319 TaxID=118161 RepID=UPI0003463783|nr:hypothetical protein [Pleurocapsa sp. PCC 7319]
MELEQQLAELINDATNYGLPPIVIEKAIAPVLELFAGQLQHLEYYVLQNLDHDWILTTIANPQRSQEKKVIYAFVSVQDARTFQRETNPDLIAMPIPIAQLLFRLFSLQQVDSIIFLEDSQNFNRGIEIKREQLSNLIKQQLKQLKQNPPNIA